MELCRQQAGGVDGAEIGQPGHPVHRVPMTVAAEAVVVVFVEPQAGIVVVVEGAADHVGAVLPQAVQGRRLRQGNGLLHRPEDVWGAGGAACVGLCFQLGPPFLAMQGQAEMVVIRVTAG